MKVTLLAYTVINPDICGYNAEKGVTLLQDMEWDVAAEPSDTLAEFAGRACYQSFHKPNPDTRANRDYLRNILDQGHFSVLEHGSATFYTEGVSRNLTHELIRHRHLSYSELSQRFVDMGEAKLVVPPAIRTAETPENGLVPLTQFGDASHDYAEVTDILLEQGKSRKQAREAARYFLLSGMETRIVVTGNHRAWRDMLGKRLSPHADAEIQEFAREVLRQLKEIAPNTYQDFE